MGVLTKPPPLDQISTFIPRPLKANYNNQLLSGSTIPVIDLSQPGAEALLVRACEELGFFKVTNHGIPMELMAGLEVDAMKFFGLPQAEKESAVAASGGVARPFGYRSKTIGCSGDIGWVEYLLFEVTSKHLAANPSFALTKQSSASSFSSALDEYILAVRKLACDVLELMAEGLRIGEREVFSKLLKNEESDSALRFNHYPPCPQVQQEFSGRGGGGGVTGFGEHTDPQIISVLRSNNTTGLEIFLKDGSWVSVPPDQDSFFINVGDSLQVLTNGRFKSVRHRVLANSFKSRLSMIYFGGPPSAERLAPLPLLMAEGEQCLYREFTWCEYKSSAYRTKLSDNRLQQFELQVS